MVHGGTEFGEVSKGAVSKLFLKQERKFPSGAVATIVDPGKSSPVREAFSTAVIGRSVGAVEQYWQQQLFSGRDVPPVTKASDDEVLALVKSTPGAIGYVSDGAVVPSGVKVLSLK